MGSIIALFLEDREYSLKINSFMLLKTLAYTQTRQKREADAWIFGISRSKVYLTQSS